MEEIKQLKEQVQQLERAMDIIRDHGDEEYSIVNEALRKVGYYGDVEDDDFYDDEYDYEEEENEEEEYE